MRELIAVSFNLCLRKAAQQQCVKTKDVVTSICRIKHCAPSSSVLRAVLFIIHINDLCSANFKGKVITFFADNTVLFTREERLPDLLRNVKTEMQPY